MSVNDDDLLNLELMLDNELSVDETQSLRRRISAEPALAAALAELEGQRQFRRTALSEVFDSDTQSVERLVLSVRTASASEAIKQRRMSILRYSLSAAASLIIGLGIGSMLNGSGPTPVNGEGPQVVSASPMQLGGWNSNASIDRGARGISVVVLHDRTTGKPVWRIEFANREAADAFLRDLAASKNSTFAVPAVLSQPF